MTKAVFSGSCKLVKKTNLLSVEFNDWEKGSDCIMHHEHFAEDRDTSMSFLNRSKIIQRIDKAFMHQAEKEIVYWTNVLKRVVATLKAWASHGVPFRETAKKFGSSISGNYIMALKLITKLHFSLLEHIELGQIKVVGQRPTFRLQSVKNLFLFQRSAFHLK